MTPPNESILTNGALTPEQIASDPNLFPWWVVRKLQQIDDRLKSGGGAIDDLQERTTTLEDKVRRKLSFAGILTPVLTILAAAVVSAVIARAAGG